MATKKKEAAKKVVEKTEASNETIICPACGGKKKILEEGREIDCGICCTKNK